MKITKQRVTCECGHVFDAEIVSDAPFDVVAASIKAIFCPKCRGKKIYLGGAYPDAPPLTASIEDRATWWRKRGEIGTSSLTIWCAFTQQATPHGQFHYPIDPDDFRRCKQLLDLLPEWRGRLSDVVGVRFPWWKPFTDRWETFEALYAETAGGRCEKLYDVMQVAGKEADIIRSGGKL